MCPMYWVTKMHVIYASTFFFFFFWTKIPTPLCLSPYSYTLHFGYLLYSLSICFKENVIQCLPKDLLFPINIAWKHLFPSYGSHNLCFGFLPVLCGKLMPSRDRNLIMRNLMGNSECLCCNWFWRHRERERQRWEKRSLWNVLLYRDMCTPAVLSGRCRVASAWVCLSVFLTLYQLLLYLTDTGVLKISVFLKFHWSRLVEE